MRMGRGQQIAAAVVASMVIVATAFVAGPGVGLVAEPLLGPPEAGPMHEADPTSASPPPLPTGPDPRTTTTQPMASPALFLASTPPGKPLVIAVRGEPDRRLLVSVDKGATWRDVTPPIDFPLPVDVDFLDEQRGVGVGVREHCAYTYEVISTRDGGLTWQRGDLAIGFQCHAGDDTDIELVTMERVTLSSWSGVAGGGSIATSADGGIHWRWIEEKDWPGGLDAAFWDATAGIGLWPAIFGACDRAYWTDDGGRTWNETTVPHPANAVGAYRQCGSPLLTSPGRAIVPVHLVQSPTETIAVVGTIDAGRTWGVRGSLELAQSRADGRSSVSLVDDTTWWVLGETPGAGSPPSIFVTGDAGKSWHRIPEPDIPPGGTITAISGTNAYYESGSSAAGRLWVTSDRGRTWERVTLDTLNIVN